MNKSLVSTSIAVLLTATSATTFAAPISIPNTFTAGTAAKAAEVNANFTAVAAGVNTNDSRITANTTAISTNTTAIAANTSAISALQGTTGCAGNDATDVMVQVGSVCIDKYESSVWDSAAGGGTQYDGSVVAIPCAADGSDCGKGAAAALPIYARSQAGVSPSTNISWYQAAQACANAGKRLPTTAEWQLAASGTPSGLNIDPALGCNTGPGGTLAQAGAFTTCTSAGGANDMVGNVLEWTSDLLHPNFNTGAANTDSARVRSLGDDYFNSAGIASTKAMFIVSNPSSQIGSIGFRCVR